jgi:hypothetical protein
MRELERKGQRHTNTSLPSNSSNQQHKHTHPHTLGHSASLPSNKSNQQHKHTQPHPPLDTASCHPIQFIQPTNQPTNQPTHTTTPTLPWTQRILTQKARLDRRHEFALLALHDEGVALLQGFTSDTRAVMNTLGHLEPVAPWKGGWDIERRVGWVCGLVGCVVGLVWVVGGGEEG